MDVIGARAVAELRSSIALATTSFSVARAAGLSDEQLTLDANLAAVCGIASVAAEFNKPLTVDLDIVGINLEDCELVTGNLYCIDEAASRIERILEVARRRGVPDFVVNARCNALVKGLGLDEVLSRGEKYLAAGATTVFPYDTHLVMRYLTVAARPLVCALGILHLVGATTILTFSDKNCTASSGSIEAKDDTGSGACRKLTSGYTSFMIGTLGDGCAVTIYGYDADDPICSATNNTIAEETVCYNSTWTYFSVDGCSPVTSTSTSILTSISTSSTSTSASTPAPITSTTSTTTPTNTAVSGSHGTNVGAIVGGTISGVFVVGLLAGAAFYFFWFRPKHQRQLAELPGRSDTFDTFTSGNNDAYAKKDPHAKANPYTVLPGEPQVYELSPQYIAEVHEQTHVRHELPP
ncbi:hypothetical protein GQX73_g5072 [Xylaria multiplex]|uniref:Uncharacterized protein n=1 Tax=Xylaria multiplex TaxID=323545 RepID=A0A7C8MSL5_9PEZI|nr:hypothetical protein GQX73_g5072 [Xylaria multiplex]